MEFLTRVPQFFREVAAEFGRVPQSRAEVARSTVVVLVVVVVLALPGSRGRGISKVVEVILK